MFGTNGYSLGMALLYVFFWIRLQIVFEETSMRLSTCMKISFSILLLIQLTTTILSTYYFMLGWNQKVRAAALNYWTMFTWTNIFSSSLVIITFIKQILSVILRKTWLNRPKAVNNVSNSVNELNETTQGQAPESDNVVEIESDIIIDIKSNQRQYKIWRLIIKCMICAMVALLSTIVIAIFSTMQSTIPDWHSNLTMRGAHIAIRVMDETINLICLCLQFPFSKPLYKRLCGNVDAIVSERVMIMINLRTQA